MIPLPGLCPDGGHQNAVQTAERIRYINRRQGIVSPPAIDDKPIFMSPWLQHQIHFPTATGLFFQRHGGWLPAIEGATLSHLVHVKRQRDPGPAEKQQIDSDKKAYRPQA